jgi:hypothetical protein
MDAKPAERGTRLMVAIRAVGLLMGSLHALHGRLTPKLRRTSIVGKSTSFTIKADKLFSDTS